VPEPKRVGQAAKGEKARMLGGVGQQQTPAGEVQNTHRTKKATQPGTLASVEGAPDQRPG